MFMISFPLHKTVGKVGIIANKENESQRLQQTELGSGNYLTLHHPYFLR